MKKRAFISIIIILALINLIKAQTSIAGGTVNGIWTLSGSPYNVNGSIMIPNGDSLIIQPGVNVIFQGTYKLLVNGKLNAKGSVTDTIVFTASNTTNGWRGIRFDLIASTNDTSIIRYCKLTYGKATGGAPDDKGGAIYINTSPKIRIENSLIENCSSVDQGAGIYCDASSPIIKNNLIKSNSTTGGCARGGGMYFNNSNPIVTKNSITNNYGCQGGGIYIFGGKPTIMYNSIKYNQDAGALCSVNCTATISYNDISNNYGIGTSSDGGLYCSGGTQSITSNTISYNQASAAAGMFCGNQFGVGSYTISNNLINNNTATYSGTVASSAGGAGLYVIGPNIKVINNIISNNVSNGCGGGLYCNFGDPFISNNLIINNSAGIGGGFFSLYNTTALFENNTIANNSAIRGGGIYCAASSTLTLRNTILWNNSASLSGNEICLFDEASDPNIYYSDIKGGTAAFDLNGNFYTGIYQNNINSDPLFGSPSAGAGSGFNGLAASWFLLGGSPCINAGDPSGTYPSTDIAGFPRVQNAIIDMGAYEGSLSAIKENILNNSISIFPNPTSGKINLVFENNLENANLKLLNVTGQIILEKTNISLDNYQIDISEQASGVYILELSVAGGASRTKVIKN